MMNGFIGRVTPAGLLKDALDVGSQRVRAIADRVSKASLQNQDGFALPAVPAPGAEAAGAGDRLLVQNHVWIVPMDNGSHPSQ